MVVLSPHGEEIEITSQHRRQIPEPMPLAPPLRPNRDLM